MQFFDSDGVHIAYIDVAPTSSAGDSILLIHGFGSNHAVNWVNTMWVKTLTHAGYRTITLDNRGHGQSGKLYDPAAYAPTIMAEDARRLLDHLGIDRADVMGYSMGARIAATLALNHPERVRSLLLGGLGLHLVEGEGLPPGIADAMEAPSLDDLTDPTERMFAPSPTRRKATARRSPPACAARARTCRGRRSPQIFAPTLIASAPRTTSPARRRSWLRCFRTPARSTSQTATTTWQSATCTTSEASSPSWPSGPERHY